MQTLGDLIDRLSITNIKLWFAQEFVHAAESMTPEEFAQLPPATVQSNLARLSSLNLTRNRLMTEIDEAIDLAARTGSAPIDARPKFTVVASEDSK